jgi:hypothetical protein
MPKSPGKHKFKRKELATLAQADKNQQFFLKGNANGGKKFLTKRAATL